MQKGTVKFFNHDKGYGFITSETKEIFVHKSGVLGEKLHEGDEVTFDLQQGKKGIVAVEVQKA